MQHKLPGLFILFFLLVSGVWLDFSPSPKRAPASLWAGCAQACRLVVSVVNSPWLGFIRRVPKPSLGQLDGAAVNAATMRFTNELNAGVAFESINPQTMEETLGLIEAVLVTKGYARVDYAALDVFKRGKLASLLRQLDRPSRFSLESYENIWAEIFVTRIGRWERFKSVFDSDHAKRQALALFMQEEVARLGLIRSAKKYALLENPEPIIRRFNNSKLGKTLGTSLFNLPMLFGMPPLVFPRLSRLRLPEDLARDLLEQGLTQGNMTRVDEFLAQASAKRFGIGLSTADRYELIRRSYTVGLGVYFLALASWEAYVRYHAIDEEDDSLSDAIVEVEDLLEKAEFLQSQGYDIFDDVPEQKILTLECRDLQDCLELELGRGPWDKNSAAYKECRAFVDPKNRCQEF